jgi:acetyl-CoA synthetase
MCPYPGRFCTGEFCTGDGAARDDRYIWIKGRFDDVINVSGHRLSTAEIESASILHRGQAEVVAIGVPNGLTGQAVMAFVTLKL